MNKIDIAGLKVNAVHKSELLDALDDRLKSGQKIFITTLYSEFLFAALQDRKVSDMLNKADVALADGIGVIWAAKFLSLPFTARNYWLKILQAFWQTVYSGAAIIFRPGWVKSIIPEKIVGADLIWDLAEMAANHNRSIYLLGGFGDTPKIIKAKLISQYPDLKISGYSNKDATDISIFQDIQQAKPDMLFVAFGPLKQEAWIAKNIPYLPVKLAIGLGGTFDYLAGKKPVPPGILRQIGLEWLYRLFTQPHRIKRIYKATFGLANMLIHYKVFHSYLIRPNVAVIILNKKNQVLVCQRSPDNFYVDIITTAESLKRRNYWQFPQGGVDPNEDIVQAARREALEETNIKDMDFIGISSKTNTYIWNNSLRKFWKNRRHLNFGQAQKIVYFRFTGDETQIQMDNDEFISHRWEVMDKLDKIIHPERTNLAKIVKEDLLEMQQKAII